MKGDVIVTGGAGYVGSHACKALARAGYRPITLDNFSTGNRWAVRYGPLEVADTMRPDQLDAIFTRWQPLAVMHFAAVALVGESMTDPALYYRQNVTGTLNLLDACRASGCTNFVFSSTCAVYGTPETPSIDERTPERPVNPYGASKAMAERMLADHAMAHGLRYVALRYFNAAGADHDGEIGESRAIETHLIPLALDAALGRRPPLRVMGTDYATQDGTAVRDYLHVDDLARAHVGALERLDGGGGCTTLNLGSGDGHSVRQVVDTIERVTGRTVQCIKAARRPGDPPRLVADITAARRELGFEPCANLERIVETAWRWAREAPPRAA